MVGQVIDTRKVIGYGKREAVQHANEGSTHTKREERIAKSKR